MYTYIINIAFTGTDFVTRHYVRVAVPSGADAGEARAIAQNFAARFPEAEGYKVTMTAWGRSVGNEVVI